MVAPSRVRGLKPNLDAPDFIFPPRRTFTGAWIETFVYNLMAQDMEESHLHGCVD